MEGLSLARCQACNAHTWCAENGAQVYCARCCPALVKEVQATVKAEAEAAKAKRLAERQASILASEARMNQEWLNRFFPPEETGLNPTPASQLAPNHFHFWQDP